ncbi:MAG: NAD(P)/FAD-dependent oxidoreductase [Lachnospiraceae bacterium]|nr:NAD(P)/FAD-dependent oxidoreductase [Lachnospiraceae bacterium]
MYDAIIIGAGVIGAAVARELSRYQCSILVLEKGEDVCVGTSKANSGLVHAGFDAKPGSLKAKYNVQGSLMMEELCRKLDVPYERNGALVLAFSQEEMETLQGLKRQGEENGVKELAILEKEQLRKQEPSLSKEAVAALYAPTAALVCPFLLTIALAENANMNGAEFLFEREVTHIQKAGEGYEVKVSSPANSGKQESYLGKNIINCAGLYSDKLHNMVSKRSYQITPVKGEYCLLDKSEATAASSTLFRVPGKMGKGVLVTRTVHGNLLLGPTAESISDKEETATSREGLEKVLTDTRHTVPDLNTGMVITSFAGLRAHERDGDFVIGEAEDAHGFFDAVGIESPGLSSAPAIGSALAGMIAEKNNFQQKEQFQEERKGIVPFVSLSPEEKEAIVKEKPAYGNMICRCEMITEGEILEAIHRPLGAKSLDGLKRRVRTGMGRCQGGFCTPKLVEILEREWGISKLKLTKTGGSSRMLADENR